MAVGLLFTACQDKDIDIASPLLTAPDADAISATLEGDDLIWSWKAQGGLMMQVTTMVNGTKNGASVVTGNSFTQSNVDTNVPYRYVFKLTDGTNYSVGVVKDFLRKGASKISGLGMSQLDKSGGYDALVEWNSAPDAEEILLEAVNGNGKTVSKVLSGSATSFLIEDVVVSEEWTVSLVAKNSDGLSLKTSSSLKIGKTAIGFISVYSTPEELLANGDDDEASAWLWFQNEYATGKFISFSDVKTKADVDPYRVIFWMRDLEGVGESEVFNMPEVVNAALPVITEWYKDGGSLLLWGHAMPLAAHLGRIQLTDITNNDRAIGTGFGGMNGDVWKMAVQLNPGGKFSIDMSTHPIYKGIECESTDRTKLIPVKGAGWTEDHNCLFFNLPSQLTGLGNQDMACYTVLTEKYGIYPLATWDSQIDFVSQLNIWEARQGNTEFKGTLLCIGNGGCEFSMKNEDGTPDISAMPKNNPYQSNVLKLAKNSLEYLKTR